MWNSMCWILGQHNKEAKVEAEAETEAKEGVKSEGTKSAQRKRDSVDLYDL